MDLILSTKSLGIEHFLKQEYHLAIEQYSKAIDLALKLYKNSKDVKKQIVLLYSNRSICHYKLDLFPEAVKDADKAIKIDARFAKGYVRRAVALESMNNLKEALQDYQKALKIEPNANAYKIGRGNIVMKMVSSVNNDVSKVSNDNNNSDTRDTYYPGFKYMVANELKTKQKKRGVVKKKILKRMPDDVKENWDIITNMDAANQGKVVYGAKYELKRGISGFPPNLDVGILQVMVKRVDKADVDGAARPISCIMYGVGTQQVALSSNQYYQNEDCQKEIEFCILRDVFYQSFHGNRLLQVGSDNDLYSGNGKLEHVCMHEIHRYLYSKFTEFSFWDRLLDMRVLWINYKFQHAEECGKKNPRILEDMHELGETLEGLKQYKLAAKIYEENAKEMVKQIGKDEFYEKSIPVSLNCCGLALKRAGKFLDAEKMYCASCVGNSDHEIIKNVFTNLVTCYENNYESDDVKVFGFILRGLLKVGINHGDGFLPGAGSRAIEAKTLLKRQYQSRNGAMNGLKNIARKAAITCDVKEVRLAISKCKNESVQNLAFKWNLKTEEKKQNKNAAKSGARDQLKQSRNTRVRAHGTFSTCTQCGVLTTHKQLLRCACKAVYYCSKEYVKFYSPKPKNYIVSNTSIIHMLRSTDAKN